MWTLIQLRFFDIEFFKKFLKHYFSLICNDPKININVEKQFGNYNIYLNMSEKICSVFSISSNDCDLYIYHRKFYDCLENEKFKFFANDDIFFKDFIDIFSEKYPLEKVLYGLV